MAASACSVGMCQSNRLLRVKYAANISFSRYVRAFRDRRNNQLVSESVEATDEEFRVFEIPGLKPTERFSRRRDFTHLPVPPPRQSKMSPDQRWTDVWPAASTFKWSAVPLPLKQGYIKNSENEGFIPSAYANTELMKIPNFLHLTPDHIRQHCRALKNFCTEWPTGLEDEEQCIKHFPVEVITSDYCFAGPSIRDPRARVVTLRVKLDSLELDYHARDKLIRLAGDNQKYDYIKLVTDRCPLKSQNRDYAMYLLTAIYHESWRVEPWEVEKTEADMERYFWDLNLSKPTVIKLLQKMKDADKKSPDAKTSYLPEDTSEESLLDLPQVQEYKVAVEELFNEGENHTTMTQYKNAVKNLLNLQNCAS